MMIQLQNFSLTSEFAMGSKMGAADPNYPKIQGLSRLSRLSYGIAAFVKGQALLAHRAALSGPPEGRG